jgi:hypothetical protein
VQVTGALQLRAWQRRELASVEQVTGGVWSVPVPLPDNPMRYVLSYVIEHGSGFVLTERWLRRFGPHGSCGPASEEDR